MFITTVYILYQFLFYFHLLLKGKSCIITVRFATICAEGFHFWVFVEISASLANDTPIRLVSKELIARHQP